MLNTNLDPGMATVVIMATASLAAVIVLGVLVVLQYPDIFMYNWDNAQRLSPFPYSPT